MKLEEGMYVRIDDDIRTICLGIGKILKIFPGTIKGDRTVVHVDMNKLCLSKPTKLPISFNEEKISKSSFNIIDLIEIGDYVNGKKVIYIAMEWYEEDDRQYPILTLLDGDSICSNEIQSIVTKEQFKQIEYVVNE